MINVIIRWSTNIYKREITFWYIYIYVQWNYKHVLHSITNHNKKDHTDVKAVGIKKISCIISNEVSWSRFN